MSGFSTRVELHNASWSHYETLHGSMAVQGFKRTIKADNGVTYQLPTAEYRFDGFVTKADVLEKAKVAANTTGLNYEIFVVEGDNWISTGLTPVSRAA